MWVNFRKEEDDDELLIRILNNSIQSTVKIK